MRRRSFDLRRQARRRWFDGQWGCVAVGGLTVLMLFLFLGRESKPRSPSLISQIMLQEPYRSSLVEALNISDEMLSPLSTTRQLVDQISLAKAFVIIAKDNNNLQLAADLSFQIHHSQSLLSSSATLKTSPSPEESQLAIRNMASLLYQAQQVNNYDTATTIAKLKSKIQSLEEKSKSETEKSTKFGQIAAEELPKSLYCLAVRLTTEWFRSPNLRRKLSDSRRMAITEKLTDNQLYHFCVFSDNILAVTAVINSTTINSQRPDLIVFHLVTDEVNFLPMRAWFLMNDFRGAAIEVQKVEDFTWLNSSYVPVLKQLQDSQTQNFYFSGTGDSRTPIKFRNPKYLSLLNHLRFYIPEVFPELQKMVFLDDDVVVQKDLAELFTINLNGNVMGAVETCMETFHRFHKYLNYSHPLIRAHFDPDACGWAFGMNLIDLREWRRKNVTGIYHYWQERNSDHTLWKLGSLPPGLLAFYGLVETLDPSWHVLGLGYTNVDPKAIHEGAVLHYNGNMKPWLKIGMEKYKGLWEQYVDYSHSLLQQCYIH